MLFPPVVRKSAAQKNGTQRNIKKSAVKWTAHLEKAIKLEEDRTLLMYLKQWKVFHLKLENSVQIKYAVEAALCEFAPPEDFQDQ